MKKSTAIAVMTALTLISIHAEGLTLRHLFRAEIDPIDPLVPSPVDYADIKARVLEEARRAYSGMIWGFRFTYVPMDKTRNIEESFKMESAQEISTADPRLLPDAPIIEGTNAAAYVDFRMNADETDRFRQWSGSLYPRSQGEGRVPARSRNSRFAAIEDAVRSAVREYARGATLNKPREITGWCAFEQPADIRFQAGHYLARVKIRLKIEEIRHYEVF